MAIYALITQLYIYSFHRRLSPVDLEYSAKALPIHTGRDPYYFTFSGILCVFQEFQLFICPIYSVIPLFMLSSCILPFIRSYICHISLKRAAANSAMCLRKLDFAPLFTDKSAASTQLPLGLMYCVHFNGSFHDVSLRTTCILAAAGAFNGSLRYEPLAAYLIFYVSCVALYATAILYFSLFMSSV